MWWAILLALLAAFFSGIALTMAWINHEANQPDLVLLGDFRGDEVWAQRDGRFWWRLWLVHGTRRVALRDPETIGAPDRWTSLSDARRVALRQGVVERIHQ